MYFSWKKIFVKFIKLKKIVGQIRGENIRGGGGEEIFLMPCPPKENLKRRPCPFMNILSNHGDINGVEQ